MNKIKEGSLFRDSVTMFIRSLKLSFRSPATIALAILAPASMLGVFVYVFGGALDVGDYTVVNFIVPGVILLSIGQSAPIISVRINNDMTKGVIDRFRTMPIAKPSILIGHVSATVLQSIVTVTAAISVALLVGFRPQADIVGWLMASGIMLLYIIMTVWMATLFGVFAKNSEGASGVMTLIGVLPFLSSGFVPTETMPNALRVFAENQPMTPIINSVRALLLNQPLADGTLLTALLWCVGLAVFFYVTALRVYNRKTTK
jgi:ABC-2 type transport system permease protein